MIAAGKMNRQVTLYAPTSSRSATGTEKSTFTKVATVWGERASLFLREATRMAGLAEGAEAKLIIRFRTDVATGWQVECDKRRYTVVSVEDIGNREGLALLVRAI